MDLLCAKRLAGSTSLDLYCKTLPENHRCPPGSPGSQSTGSQSGQGHTSRGPWEAAELAFQQGQLSEEESQLQALPPEILAQGQESIRLPGNNSAYTPSRAPQCPPDKDLIQGCHSPVMWPLPTPRAHLRPRPGFLSPSQNGSWPALLPGPLESPAQPVLSPPVPLKSHLPAAGPQLKCYLLSASPTVRSSCALSLRSPKLTCDQVSHCW